MGYLSTTIALLFMSAFQGLSVYANYWLTYWTEDTLLKNLTLGHTEKYEEKFVYYLAGYTIIGVLQGNVFHMFLFFGLLYHYWRLAR